MLLIESATGSLCSCGKPIYLGKKFCSDECYTKERNNKPWKDVAVDLYQREKIGFKAVAKSIGIPAQAVYWTLKQRGVLNGAAHKLIEHQRRKTDLEYCKRIFANAKRKPKVYNVNELIIEDYVREAHAGIKLDERAHWLNHPERLTKLRQLKYKSHATRKTNYHLASRLRTRIYNVLKGNTKSAPTLTMLGCSLPQFRIHLEDQFKRGMNWSNYGNRWHMDHIIPCDAFDLREPSEQRKCFHFSNIRPLEAKLNWSKHARVVRCQPEMLLTYHRITY